MPSPLLAMLGRASANGAIRFLDRDEELDLVRRWQDHGDQAARDDLLASIAPLASKMTAQFCRAHGCSTACQEYESEAFEGILHAIDKFDRNIGARLSTYAGHWINQRLQKAFRHDRLVQVPGHLFHERNRRESTNRELAELAGQALATTVSLSVEEWDHDEPLVAFLPGRESSPDDEAQERERHDQNRLLVQRALARLDTRTQRILVARYFEGKTLYQVGAELGITKERVRQLQEKGLRRMRENLEYDESPMATVTTDDPLALIEALHRLSPAEIDVALRRLEDDRRQFEENYQRRRRLLMMAKKALRGKADYRTVTEDQLLDRLGELQPASASKLGGSFGVSPQGMGKRLAMLKAEGKARRGPDGRWSLVHESAKRKRGLAG